MHRSLLFAVAFLLVTVSFCLANDDDDSNFFFRTIFEEGFEGSFLPSGWKQDPTDNDWRRETPRAGDGWEAHEGIRAACVGGDGSGVLDDRLISKRIDIAGQGVGFDADNLNFTFMVTAFDQDALDQLRIEICTDSLGDDNWFPISHTYESGGDDDDDTGDLEWQWADVDLNSYMDEAWVRIAFRYNGNQSDMLCIDGINLNLLGEYSDSDGCGGCGMGNQKPAVPLVAFMVLIGLAGLLIAKKRS